MVRTQAQRQHQAALGGSPGRKPPLDRNKQSSPSGRIPRKPQGDNQVLPNEDVVVNHESENSAIVEATEIHGDPATSGDPPDVHGSSESEKSPILQVHGSSSTADEVVTEQRRSGRPKRTSPGKEKRLVEEARLAADNSPSDIDPDDDDEYRTSPKQLPVIKKLKKQGRTIKPFSPQGNLCRLHRTLVFVM